MSMIGTTCKLCIVEVFPEDEGKYVCKAVNSAGEATTSCIVFVEGRLSPLDLMLILPGTGNSFCCFSLYAFL